MNAKAQTKQRPTARAAYNGEHQQDRREPGIDVPVLGHVPYKSIGFLAGLGVAGVAGALDWPVVAAVGVGYALARR